MKPYSRKLTIDIAGAELIYSPESETEYIIIR
jgi:hypothetical protein